MKMKLKPKLKAKPKMYL